MGDRRAFVDEQVFRRALSMLVATKHCIAVARREQELDDELSTKLVERVADGLAEMARDPFCPPAVGTALLDWRDRLWSHILAAGALAELDIDRGLPEQLLRRGLDEIIDGIEDWPRATSPASDAPSP